MKYLFFVLNKMNQTIIGFKTELGAPVHSAIPTGTCGFSETK